MPLLGNRHDDGPGRRLLPGAARPVERGRQVDDDRRGSGVEGGADRPDRVVEVHRATRDGIAGQQIAGGRERQRRVVRLHQVREREREVAGLPPERALHGLPHAFGRLTRCQRAAELPQQAQAAGVDRPVRVLRDHAEHAGNPAVVLVQRAVGERVVGLFREAAALEEQPQAFIPGGLAGGQYVLDPRPDDRPDLRPHLARRPAERPRVLGAQGHPGVGIVVEEGQVRAPAHPHGVARGEHHADDRPDALRPLRGRPDGRALPVELTHHRRQLARSDEQGLGLGCAHRRRKRGSRGRRRGRVGECDMGDTA